MKKRMVTFAMALAVCAFSISILPLHVDAKDSATVKQGRRNNDDFDQSDYYNSWQVSEDGWNNNRYDMTDDADDDDWYDDDDNDDWYDADDNDDWYDDDDADDDDDWYDDELTADDLSVNPTRKKICRKKSFYIKVVPADDSDWEDVSEDEWNEVCEENIESIKYSSTKKKVATVNAFTGKVKAKKKGRAVIKTKVYLDNGESVTFKTVVTVKK